MATFILSMLGGFCGTFMAIVLMFATWDDSDDEDFYDEVYNDY